MLVVGYDLFMMFFKEVDNVAVDDVFNKFTGDKDEGDRSVVGCIACVGRPFVDGCGLGLPP